MLAAVHTCLAMQACMAAILLLHAISPSPHRVGKHRQSAKSLATQFALLASLLPLLCLPCYSAGQQSALQDSEWLDPSLQKTLGPFSKCAEGHVAMKPKKGDALVFWG
jgi:hypothetical protein